MAKLYAKISSNDKPARSITSDEIIMAEFSFKNRLIGRVYVRIENDKPVIELQENARDWNILDNIVTEQKPKVEPTK